MSIMRHFQRFRRRKRHNALLRANASLARAAQSMVERDTTTASYQERGTLLPYQQEALAILIRLQRDIVREAYGSRS